MQDQHDLQARLEAALAEGQCLREEVRQLKAILAQHSIRSPEPTTARTTTERCLPAPSDIAQVGTLSDNQAKIALFRSLFRGREDVYAERWRTKDGTWAYRPAGKKDWQAVLASRPKDHKKVDRETRTLYAVTDEVIRQHLTGKKTIGIYPLLLDETCWFLAAEITNLTIHDAYAALVTDEGQNRQIVADIVQAVREGRTPLVLTNRTDHLEQLASGLSEIQHVLILKGGMGKKQRQAAAEKLVSIPDGAPRVLLATGSYIGEGFDDSQLDTLFLTMPISWQGTLQQYVGRLHRIHQDKKVVRVYDYVDAQVPMLCRMYEKRLKGYRAIGYAMESDDQVLVENVDTRSNIG